MFVEVFCLLMGVLGILSNSLFSIKGCQYLGRKFFWETHNADI